MTTDFRALCVELTDCIDRARAALAQPELEVAEPTDEELLAFQDEWFNAPGRTEIDVTEFQRATLARWGTPNLAETRSSLGDAPAPVPVPVSERLPQAEDCDEKGCCWLWSTDDVDGVGHWSYSHRDWAQEGDVTHWLPASALPQPQGEGSDG